MERKLAAILAADVVGYSALMERDEKGTFARLKAHRNELLEPEIKKHHGRIFKLMGDGLLAEFGSVVDAVECAVAVQKEMAKRNDGAAPDERIDLRIGINLGDVIVEGEDIHGEGVNIAARLEALAEPGGICISAKVHDEVRGKLDCTFEDMGEQAVKNIARPVRAYRLRLGTAAESASAARPSLSLPDKPSIAVLPFQNMSGDPEQEYFADGMVEEIITALSRMRWLFVIARNSSFTYKGRAVDVKQVGRELGVRYVLEGSVRKAGNRVRITGQLIDAVDGRASLGGPFRRRAGGHLRSAGSGDRERGRRHRAEAGAGRDRAGQAQADRKPRRLRLFSARHGGFSSMDQGGQQRGAAAVLQGHRTRPQFRCGLWHGGALLLPAQGERLGDRSRA